MNAALCAVLCVVVLVGGALPAKIHYDLEDAERLFDLFMIKYHKVYRSELERAAKFEVFKRNLATLNDKNDKDENATFDINAYTDRSRNELLRTQTGFQSNFARNASPFTQKKGMCITRVVAGTPPCLLPESFDWRDKNVVTPVKDQLECGSCWAFTAIANFESQYAIKHGKHVDFSEQHLLDCDQLNYGCDGGLMHWAFEEIIRMGGVVLEYDYPYTGVESFCANNVNMYTTISGCVQYDLRDEEKLRELLVTNGPIAVALDIVDIVDYKSGVVSFCGTNNGLNHAVLLVGYGVDKTIEYWLLKNSWGTDWGEEGYFRIKRNRNSCGILNSYAASVIL
uniref:Viral cathepsin n=1 Tax=Achaea janata granulovirus TaxID=262174 RepID=L7VIN8_9BBAC|nr:cathepsin [Achaea janata granulovirus]